MKGTNIMMYTYLLRTKSALNEHIQDTTEKFSRFETFSGQPIWNSHGTST